MNVRSPQLVILVLFWTLTSGSGCQVLNIPSYRADSCSSAASYSPAEVVGPNAACPPGFLPPLPAWIHAGVPVPGWWAEWKAKKDLPEPAPYPRFQPLPTRPMFSPQTREFRP